MIFLALFFEFFKIGLFTFGGGYAMIPLLKEVVLEYGWLTEEIFYDFIGVCESTPGIIAINMATYVGSSVGSVYGILGRIIGSLVSTLGVVLPAYLVLLVITIFISKITNNKYVKYVLKGVNAVALGLILSTGLIMLYNILGLETYNNFNFDIKSLIVFVMIVITYLFIKLVFKKKMNNLIIIALGGALGIIVCLII